MRRSDLAAGPGYESTDAKGLRNQTMKLLFSRAGAEWLSASFVVICGALTGHYASMGMNAVQWAGAAAAVLGSVTAAVTLRVWPGDTQAEADQQRETRRED